MMSVNNIYDLRPELARSGRVVYSLQLGDLSSLKVDVVSNEVVFPELPTEAEVRQYIVNNIDELTDPEIAFMGFKLKGKYYLSTAKVLPFI